MTQKANKKEVTDKTDIESKLKQDQRVKMRLIKIYLIVLIPICVLGVFTILIFKHACKHPDQVTTAKPKESMVTPKSESTDKEIPVNPMTGKGDEFILEFMDGTDIDDTSKNDTNATNYFQAWQNSLRVVFFHGPYESISFETELDEDVVKKACAQAHSFIIFSMIFIIVLVFILNVSLLSLEWIYCYKYSGVPETLTA